MGKKNGHAERQIMSVIEAAEYLGVSKTTLYVLLKNDLPSARLSGRRVIRKSDIDALIERSITPFTGEDDDD